MDFLNKKCIPCEGGVSKIPLDKLQEYLGKIENWHLIKNVTEIEKQFKFKNFVDAVSFVNRVADVAEKEGHHPDITIHYNRVTIELWTHSIGGLSQNDFILASCIEKLT